MYVALCYIGNDYTPGEVLPESVSPEVIERLLKAGAIREDNGADAQEPAGEAEPPEAKDEPADEEPEEAEAEYDEELEAPEVDVTAALVSETKPRAKKGAKTK